MKELAEYIPGEKYEFYEENGEDFYVKVTPNSGDEIAKKCYGDDNEYIPAVTILVATCKRPSLLKNALDSAINQIGYEDYQIIVCDNECAPIDVETQTSMLVKSYSPQKVCYYRYLKACTCRMDMLVSFANSKWILFLHDDDMLSPYALKVLTEAAEENPGVKWIHGGKERVNFNICYEDILKDCRVSDKSILQIRNRWYCGLGAGWLGTLIDREAYISIGGMPSINIGIGDYILGGKFTYKFGTAELDVGKGLYYYRIHEGQTTASDKWSKLYVNEYYVDMYDLQKRRIPFKFLWRRKCVYDILDKIKRVNQEVVYSADVNEKCFRDICNISPNVQVGNLQYKIDQFVIRIVYHYRNVLFGNKLTRYGRISVCDLEE